MNDFDFFWPKNCLKSTSFSIKTNQNHSKINKKDNVILTKNTNKINLDEPKLTKELTIKEQNLLKLKEKMMMENRILFKTLFSNFVFSDGNIDSDIMLIGEAPGEEEDLQGIPFVGKSGKLLRYFLKEAKICDFYITNVLSWRPPDNRTPTIEEIQIMQPYLFEHVKIINPKIIVTVGTSALKAFDIKETITTVQNNIIKKDIGNIFPIYHPSYALRIFKKKKELWNSLLNLKCLIDNL